MLPMPPPVSGARDVSRPDASIVTMEQARHRLRRTERTGRSDCRRPVYARARGCPPCTRCRTSSPRRTARPAGPCSARASRLRAQSACRPARRWRPSTSPARRRVQSLAEIAAFERPVRNEVPARGLRTDRTCHRDHDRIQRSTTHSSLLRSRRARSTPHRHIVRDEVSPARSARLRGDPDRHVCARHDRAHRKIDYRNRVETSRIIPSFRSPSRRNSAVSAASSRHPPSGRGRRPCRTGGSRDTARLRSDLPADSIGRQAASRWSPTPCTQAVRGCSCGRRSR